MSSLVSEHELTSDFPLLQAMPVNPSEFSMEESSATGDWRGKMNKKVLFNCNISDAVRLFCSSAVLNKFQSSQAS